MAGPQYDEDIVEKKPSNPTTSTVLMLGIAALSAGIWLTSQELGFYLDKTSKSELSEYKQKASVQWRQWLKEDYEKAGLMDEALKLASEPPEEAGAPAASPDALPPETPGAAPAGTN